MSLLSFSMHVALNCPKALCVPEVTAEDYKPEVSIHTASL